MNENQPASPASTTPRADAAPPAARSKLRQQQKARLKMLALGLATGVIVVALAIPGKPPTVVAPRQLLTEPAPAPAAAADAVSAQPQAQPATQATASVSTSVISARTVTEPVKKAPAPKPRTSHPVESPKAARTEAVSRTPAPEPVAASASAATVSAGPAPVTITGCLEMSVDETEFRLTDTDGAGAPKSRNWRTGFLKKRSAPVALVDLDAHALRADVGKRVSATGQMTGGSMKVSALHVVTPSCN